MWRPIDSLLNEGTFYLTRIEDEKGIRNEALLKKQGNLWFLAGGVYVYYTPTHYFMTAKI